MTIQPTIDASQLDGEDFDRAAVAFDPCDSSTHDRQQNLHCENSVCRRSFAEAVDIGDDELVDRLVAAGFTPETLPALEYAPIAFIAWTSDPASAQRGVAAIYAIYECQLLEHPAALARLRSWIDSRSSPELQDLWSRYIHRRLQCLRGTDRQQDGPQLLERAVAVALTSGGLLEAKVVSARE